VCWGSWVWVGTGPRAWGNLLGAEPGKWALRKLGRRRPRVEWLFYALDAGVTRGGGGGLQRGREGEKENE
jgi:hypothetical protein